MACCGQKTKQNVKLSDLAAKTSKAGQDASVKGGGKKNIRRTTTTK